MNRRFDGLGAAGSVGVLLALIALWWAASHGGWVSRVFLPSPEATLDSLLTGLGAGGEQVGDQGVAPRRVDARRVTDGGAPAPAGAAAGAPSALSSIGTNGAGQAPPPVPQRPGGQK